MAKAFTIKTLENLKPGPARREIPDGLLPGLYFILQPSGKASWACRYRQRGQSRKLTLGPFPIITLQHARELARTALARVADGCDPAREKRIAKAPALVHGDVIEKVVPEFIERYARPNQKPSSVYETERVLIKEVVERWKGQRLSEIGKSDILAMLDEIIDRGSPVLANRCLATFRKMCDWAVERGMLDASPCGGIKAPALEKSRDRVLSDDELADAWRAAESIGWPFGTVTQLLILTGQRRSEVAELPWCEIDFGAKLWTLPRERSKNDREHTIPLSKQVLAILATVPKVESKKGYVFTFTGSTPVTGFALAKRRLDAALPPDMPAWTLHDLRRTFATGLARLGIPVHVTEAVLNHRGGTIKGVAAVYNRYSYDTEKRAAMDKWATYLDTLLWPGSTSF
jgi:integrase